MSRILDRIRQRQSLYRLAFDDPKVTRAMLRAQAEEFEKWLAALTEPDHEHYWVDAPDDETGWYCTICGETEYPGDPGIGAAELTETEAVQEFAARYGIPLPKGLHIDSNLVGPKARPAR